jgi:hypothetical protein
MFAFLGAKGALAALLLGAVWAGVAQAQGPRSIEPVLERFRAFKNNFEQAHGQAGQALAPKSLAGLPPKQPEQEHQEFIEALKEAHGAHRWRDITAIFAEGGEAIVDRQRRHDQWLSAFALVSSFFWQRAYGATVDVCAVASEGLQRNVASAQVRKVGNMCALAALTMARSWVRLGAQRDANVSARLDALRAFVFAPGWEQKTWSSDPAPLWIASARQLLRTSAAAVRLGVLGSDVMGLRHGRHILARVHETPKDRQNTRLYLLLAVHYAAQGLPGEALESATVAADDKDPMIAAMGLWLKAKFALDLGREREGAVAFESSSELLVDVLRADSFQAVVDPVRTTLASRLVFDGCRALDASGLADRALVVATHATDTLGRLIDNRGAQVTWLHPLYASLLSERARLMAKSMRNPSPKQRSVIDALFGRAVSHLEGMANQVLGSNGKDAEAQVRLARGLGLRGRSYEAARLGVTWQNQSQSDAEVLDANNTILSLQAAAVPAEHLPGFIWAEASFAYMNEFSQGLVDLVETMKSLEKSSVVVDSSESWAEGSLLRVIQNTPRALAERLAVRSVLDGHTDSGLAHVNDRLGAVLDLLRSESLQREDWLLRRKALSDAALQSATSQRRELFRDQLQAADTLLEASTQLVEAVVARGWPQLSATGRTVVEKQAVALSLGLAKAHDLVATALAKEEDWQKQWLRSRERTEQELAKVERLRQDSLKKLTDVLGHDGGRLDGLIANALANRHAVLTESLLQAQATGLLGAQSAKDHAARLKLSLGKVGHVLNKAADGGGLR